MFLLPWAVCGSPAKGNDDYTLDRPSTYGEHYEVIKKIGEGSFGIIYEGSHLFPTSSVMVIGRSDMAPSHEKIAIKFV